MLIDTLLILVGFLLLVKGGDYLVLGAVNIARTVRLSPMVIGLTVVGFGTSMPELLVSAQAALKGSPGIAIGNVVGSNIANIGLILGLCALIYPLNVSKSSLKIHLPYMILSVVLLMAAGMTGTIRRVEGLLFLCILVGYVVWQVRDSRRHPDPNAAEQLKEYPDWRFGKAAIVTLLSFAALVLGANALIKGATGWALNIGEWVGADPRDMERIIGLTVVAVGTSLPELFASVMAARRHQADIALGNIVGSVSFNVLCVIGVSATICPIRNSDAGFLVSYAVMVGISLLLYLTCYTHRSITRAEGAVLLACYLAYLASLGV